MTDTVSTTAVANAATHRARTAGGEARGSRWSVLTRWRDWRIPVKLGAVILVPVVFAIVLGVLQIGAQIDRAESYRQVDRLVAVNDNLRKVLTWLQRERNKAAILLTTGSRDVAFEIVAERQSVDTARDALVRSVARARFDNEVTRIRYAEVDARFVELIALRAKVAESTIDGSAALTGYSTVIRALIGFDRAAAEEVADPTLAGSAGALHDLEAAKEEVYFQQGTVGVGIARGGLSAAELDELRSSQARLDDRTAEFRAIATPAQQAEYDRLLSVPGVANRLELLRLAVGDSAVGQPAPAGVPLPITSVDWNGASELTSGRISNVSSQLGTEIKRLSAESQDTASDAAGIAAVVLIVALVAAAAVMIIIGRQLLRSLSALRRSALDVAEHRLPAAVARIRDSKDMKNMIAPTVEPVEVNSGDEIGQVARAFDAVHEQALRLATEQAGLRANYADVFVNLSRRSQGLVQRQLQLLERLERDEEDADQLATLFQLDHLATRMRRNNENLMVLSGSDLARRPQQPANLGDLLRAAVSEIEQYQRVVIQPPPTVLVVGYAIGDLVRLTAELLDNAAAFSAPATQVTISSHHTDGGIVRIEVIDRGIGMTERELAEANARLADTGTVDASTSRRMGLFVVGRLAARHGVRVRLRPGAHQGLRAEITIPDELVTSAVVEPPVEPPVVEPETLPPNGQVRGQTNGHSGARSNGHGGARSNGHGPTAPTNGHTNRHSNGHMNGHELPRRSTNGTSVPSPLTALTKGDGAALPETPPQPGEQSPRPERLALPRREPSDVESGPAHAAPPSPSLPVEALFTSAGSEEPEPDDSGWWDTTLVHARVPEVPSVPGPHETTPIFDEMVSAWFRAVTDDPNSTAADARSWDFAADQGFSAARAVSVAEPDTFTHSGLPRRTPRQNLVPGSAEGRGAAPVPERDADDLRTRLSSFQRGVHRARGPHHADPAHASDEGLDLRGARWQFAADSGWQAAEAVATSTPDSTTSGGLPRRTPRERLLPGSLDPAVGVEPPRVARDADALRTR
ncbi:MAG: nitrate- and nitrite sensing domain-containing protein, partial [Actinomycetota bacterium]|nr:nitrate- and nitrite sensing domain-containing protein [Actinomycetota bacterium]